MNLILFLFVSYNQLHVEKIKATKYTFILTMG